MLTSGDLPFTYDFYYLWAAGSLSVQGLNPYSAVLFENMVRGAGWPASEAVQAFTHPPHTLWLYMPFGLLPFATAQILWVLGMCLCLILSIKELWQSRETLLLSPAGLSIGPCILGIVCFPPVIKTFVWGQNSFITLAAILYFLYHYDRRELGRAGIILSLAALKPHIVMPLLTALLVSQLLQKETRLGAGFLMGICVQIFLVHFINPELLGAYIDNLPHLFAETKQIRGATISQFLTVHTGAAWVREAAMLSGLVCGFFWGMFRKIDVHAILYFLLPLSLIFSPYLWSQDFVLLLPCWVQLVTYAEKKFNERVRFALLLVGAVGVLCAARPTTEGILWIMPPMIWAAILSLRKYEQNELC